MKKALLLYFALQLAISAKVQAYTHTIANRTENKLEVTVRTTDDIKKTFKGTVEPYKDGKINVIGYCTDNIKVTCVSGPDAGSSRTYRPISRLGGAVIHPKRCKSFDLKLYKEPGLVGGRKTMRLILERTN